MESIWKIFIFQIFILITISLPAEFQIFKHFTGFQVLRTNATTLEQLAILTKLYEEDNRVDFWTKPSIQRGTDIMIPQNNLESIKEYLISYRIPFTVMIRDVQKVVTQQRIENDRLLARADETGEFNWDAYQSFDSISNWLDKLARDHPDNCQVEVIGRSTEGRPMKLIKISSLLQNREKKLGIWIDGSTHAREWIGPMAVTYFINELVKNSDNYAEILSNVEFYVLPVVNPDGYSYSWVNDRMWRKTRSDYSRILSRSCRGVDPNRNFGYKYGGAGTSGDKCSNIYRGPSAFSEPETRAIRDYILNSSADFKAFLTIHSYSQVWIYPWGYSNDLPEDWEELDALAKLGTSAIAKRYGTVYEYGSSTNVLYAAAGGSDDWAKGSANIKYSYTIELRDTGSYGFLLPSNLILPTSQETWDGIQVVANHVGSLQ